MPPLGVQSPTKLLRAITSELRQTFPPGFRMQPSPAVTFLLGEFRKYQETQELYCKHKEEMAYMANTYNTYLGAQRQWRAVQQEYHATGERTVASTAKLVGLNLPHEPKISRDKPKPQREMKPAGYHPRYE